MRGKKEISISGLVWRLQCMTLQRVVSAHAAAGVLVNCRLESM